MEGYVFERAGVPADGPASGRGISRRNFLRGAAAVGLGLAGGLSLVPRQAYGHTGVVGLDPLQHREYDNLKVFTDWLKREGVRGYIGEMNWPNDEKRGFGDEARWNALGEEWYRWADAANLWVTMHNVDEYQRWGGFWLCAYVSAGDGETRPVSRPLAQASVYERHPSTSRYRRGMQVSPGQRWEDEWSNRFAGTYGKDYWYVSQETLSYLRSRGTDIVRLPFRWERIQPALGGALASAELSQLKACVSRAGAAGLKVVLSLQNHAGYYLYKNGASREYKIGSPEVTPAHLYDVWRKLSYHFKSNPTVIAYDLANEPEGMPSSGSLSPQRFWEQVSQGAVNAIRGGGDRKLLMIPGYNWSMVGSWARYHPKRWISDPAANHMYTAHHYFDKPNGRYERSYNDAVAYWRSRGY